MIMSFPSIDCPLSAQSALPFLAPALLEPSYCTISPSPCALYDQLAEAFCCNPFASSCLDPPCCMSRKRRATVDLPDEFSHFDAAWQLKHEMISPDSHSLSQLIHGDHSPLHHNYPANPAPMSTNHVCSDLEDVLNVLWMEDDTASTTHSAASPHASSDHISFISDLDLDLDYGSHDSSSHQQAELTDGPSSTNIYCLEVNQAEQEGLAGATSSKHNDHPENDHQHIRASWQQKEDEIRASWQQQQQIDSTRASWQQGETRASWQQNKGGIRASWQQKQGEVRASWQQNSQGEVRASWQQKQGEVRASWQAKQRGARASWQAVKEGGIRASWQQKEEGSSAESQKALRSPNMGSNGNWAGPTLLEIESALAINGSPKTSTISTFCPIASPMIPSSTEKHNLSSLFDVKKLLSDDLPKITDDLPEQDSLSSSWRLKLQKRSRLEPNYTVKVESVEKAFGDGYRWRKYGQKSIKNNPFPRSYYRCSTSKCNAKKQVEKCHEDGKLFLVTYEGIHLHHRPNPLQRLHMIGDLHEDEKGENPSHICSPSSSTSCSYSIPPPEILPS